MVKNISIYYNLIIFSIFCVILNDYLESFRRFKAFEKKLRICTFIDKIITTELSAYLVNSKTSDYMVNGLVNINFLNVFKTLNYKVKPEIYDFLIEYIPKFNNE